METNSGNFELTFNESRLTMTTNCLNWQNITLIFKSATTCNPIFFSSLDGIVFKWVILEKQTGNVRFIKFRDSSYSLDPVLEEIEAKGLQGSKVLLEGKKQKI